MVHVKKSRGPPDSGGAGQTHCSHFFIFFQDRKVGMFVLCLSWCFDLTSATAQLSFGKDKQQLLPPLLTVTACEPGQNLDRNWSCLWNCLASRTSACVEWKGVVIKEALDWKDAPQLSCVSSPGLICLYIPPRSVVACLWKSMSLSLCWSDWSRVCV